jgi:hypothetical protein
MSAARDTAERYSIILQAIPDQGGAPAIIRLRRFLKAALRSYRLRCVRIEALDSPASPGTDAAEPTRRR